ncbi:uncharacterized protein LOC122026812 [Zingiber officinale]|uniref:uncharacterized protein LOC122026812 n=1 Tax=Zingiber officinale TaxID=94328 RepID=UPI001C4D7B72|nr:uncharacterized protein LOC122026812 [Zingiber officinale]
MAQLEAHYNSRSVIHMSYDAFTRLVAILRGRGLLRDNQYSFVEEQVAKFLHILSGQGRVRSESFFFRRSTETISRHFHKVLRALITLQDQFLVQPNGSTVSPQILNSGGRFYPYFKNCIGAIDGTHIRVKVSKEDVSRFPILAEMSRYDVETVSEIVLACCILHNFLVDFDPDEEIIAQVDRDLMNNEPDHGLANGAIARGEDG